MSSSIDVDLQPGKPPIVKAAGADDVDAWTSANREQLRAAVLEHGSILVRGLGIANAEQAGAAFRNVSNGLMKDEEAFAARQAYPTGIYSSSTWPANQPMCMHHEQSYRFEFPGMMLFACLQAAESGGATGVANATAVLEALPPDLVERFEREGWVLKRAYNEEIGGSYADVFGTEDRAVVESYCRENNIEFEWQPDGVLRTRQRRKAVVEHPVTGKRCWFNQIAFLNEWTMSPEVHEYLVEVYGADGLPFNTCFGNGDPIGADVVELINQVYDAHTLREPWQAGDLMIVDNISTAHSREPFEGSREVLVGLADAVRLT